MKRIALAIIAALGVMAAAWAAAGMRASEPSKAIAESETVAAPPPAASGSAASSAPAASPAASAFALGATADKSAAGAKAPSADAKAKAAARAEADRLARELARTRTTLATGKPQAEFQNTPTKDALQALGRMGQFSIVFDRALEEANIDLSTRPVTLRVAGMTYEAAINLMLPAECGYRIEAGYIQVTTREKSWLPLLIRTYGVRLAMAEIPDFPNAPRFDVGAAVQQAGQARGGGAVIASPPAPAAAPPTPDRIIEFVKKFVKNQNDRRIAPWDDEGGPATVQYLGGRLVVSQTDHGHRAVLKLLAMIE